MSIINDALKKTQDVYQTQQQNQGPEQPSENKTKDRIVFVATIIIAGGFVGCLVVLSILLWPKNPAEQKALVGKFSLQKQNIAPSFKKILKSPEVLVHPTTPSLKGLKLNGIAVIEGKQTALINNKIVKEGDEIEGKRVLRISNDQVKLFSGGKVLVLELKP